MAKTRRKRTGIPTARQLMEEIRLTLAPEMDLLSAIDELSRHGLSAAPVVDRERRLLGMLTEKDCLRILSVSAFHRPRGGRVANFLSPVEGVIEVDMDLFRVSEIFLGNNFPMLPVLDHGKLVGCITRQDLLQGIMTFTRAKQVEQQRVESEAREAVSPPSSIGGMQKVFSRHSKKQLVRLLGRKS